MANFVKLLQKLARDIQKQKRKDSIFKGDRRSLDKSPATQCWICEKPLLDPDNPINLDHCYYSSKFLGWAHEKSNRAKRNINFILVVGHNIQNYDLHHICLAMNNCDPSTTIISVIPATDEKNISMTFGVLIDTFVNEKGTTVKMYEHLRFIDSFKRMNGLIEKLVEILPENQFEIMKSMVPPKLGENIQLLKQKGYYPYSYMSSGAKFSDTQLPPLEKFGNTLDDGNVNITESNLARASRMWENLGCGALQDYHDAYLRLDGALLACVCEFQEEMCFTTYKLDCMRFLN